MYEKIKYEFSLFYLYPQIHPLYEEFLLKFQENSKVSWNEYWENVLNYLMKKLWAHSKARFERGEYIPEITNNYSVLLNINENESKNKTNDIDKEKHSFNTEIKIDNTVSKDHARSIDKDNINNNNSSDSDITCNRNFNENVFDNEMEVDNLEKELEEFSLNECLKVLGNIPVDICKNYKKIIIMVKRMTELGIDNVKSLNFVDDSTIYQVVEELETVSHKDEKIKKIMKLLFCLLGYSKAYAEECSDENVIENEVYIIDYKKNTSKQILSENEKKIEIIRSIASDTFGRSSSEILKYIRNYCVENNIPIEENDYEEILKNVTDIHLEMVI